MKIEEHDQKQKNACIYIYSLWVNISPSFVMFYESEFKPEIQKPSSPVYGYTIF